MLISILINKPSTTQELSTVFAIYTVPTQFVMGVFGSVCSPYALFTWPMIDSREWTVASAFMARTITANRTNRTNRISLATEYADWIDVILTLRIWIAGVRVRVRADVHVCLYVWMYACICTCVLYVNVERIHTHARTHACSQARTHARIEGQYLLP